MPNPTYSMLIAESNQVEPLEFVRNLGRGFFGSVQLVRSLVTGKEYALKIQNFGAMQANSGVDRLILNEVRNLRKIGMLQGFKRAPNHVHILMPLIKGRTVFKAILDAGMYYMPIPEAISKPCFEALQKIHSLGVTHLDIHLNNFMLKDDGEAAAIDMGLSQSASLYNRFDDYTQFRDAFLEESNSELCRFFIESSIAHMSNNKLEALLYVGMSATAAYSLAVSATARLLLFMLAKSSIQSNILDYCYANLQHYKVRSIAVRLGGFSPLSVFNPNSSIFVIVLKLSLCAYLVKRIYDSNETAQRVRNKMYRGIKGELAYAEIDRQLLIDVATVGLLFMYDMARLYSASSEIYESHLQSVDSKFAACEAIAYAPKSMLSYFGVWTQRNANNVAKAAVVAAAPLPAMAAMHMRPSAKLAVH